MFKQTFIRSVISLSLCMSVTACNTSGRPGTSSSRMKAVEDIHSMAIDPSDTTKFRVTCRYHTPMDPPEIRTAQQIRDNQVCMGQGTGGACSYTGRTGDSGSFRVISSGRVYSARVNGFDDARFVCGPRASALYDGDNLWHFNAASNKFDSTIQPDDNVTDSVMKGSNELVIFFDRDNLFALNTTDNSMDWDSSIVVKDNPSIFHLEVLRGGAMIYDGDNLITYCGGNWSRDGGPRDNDTNFRIQTQQNLLIGDGSNGTWSLNVDTCELR